MIQLGSNLESTYTADMDIRPVWEDDGVLIKMPSFPYYLLHNRDEMVAHPMISEDLNNATDDCRHAYINDLANRMWTFYLLEFPPGVTLSSSSVFKDAGDNEELDYELVNYEWTESNTTGGTRANRELWVHFTVARTDLRAVKQGRVEESKKKSKAASKLAKLGSAMSN